MLLLVRGADANQANVRGSAPMFFAAQGGHLGIVRLLLDHGVDPDQRNYGLATSLQTSSQQGYVYGGLPPPPPA